MIRNTRRYARGGAGEEEEEEEGGEGVFFGGTILSFSMREHRRNTGGRANARRLPCATAEGRGKRSAGFAN